MVHAGPTEDSTVGRGLGTERRTEPTKTSRLLLTLDVHAHPKLGQVLCDSADVLARRNTHASYFIPAGLVRRNSPVQAVLRELRARGHSVGCHGLHHSKDEDLATVSPRAEFQILKDATATLEDAVGASVSTFRAPDFRLSRRTLLFLSELGYKADLSVTPQRLSILSSSPWSFGWLFAPRAPYHPAERSPYRRGSLTIKEIPTSCFLLPLAHGTIANLHPEMSGRLLDLLSIEGRLLPRTVVVMLHPEALSGAAESWKPSFTWHGFLPRSYGGIRCRFYFLMERDPKTIRRRTMMFLERLAGAGMASESLDEYLSSIRGHAAPDELASAMPVTPRLEVGPELATHSPALDTSVS